MEPLVTVIVPVYNAEKHIKKCMDSILNQTYKNIEVILIDDGSKDDSFSICNKISKEDKRVRLYKQKNSGPGVARNYGLDLAEGEFVCFVDSDDRMALDAIERMMEHMDEQCDLIQCRYKKRYEDDTKDNEPFLEKQAILNNIEAMQDYLWNFKPIVRFAVWAKLIRKSVIENIRFPQMKNNEDVVFNAYLIDACREIKYVPETLYYVTIRQGSLSRSEFSEEKMYASIECNDRIFELIKSKAEYQHLLSRACWSKIATAINIAKTVYSTKMDEWENIIKKMQRLCLDIDIRQYKFSLKHQMAYCLFSKFPILYVKIIKIVQK